MKKVFKNILCFTSIFLVINCLYSCGNSPTSNTTTNSNTQTSTSSSNTSNYVSSGSSSISSSSGIISEYNPDKKYDVVVYGDTAAAVVAAVAASRQNAQVAIVAPNKHLGGMISGGRIGIGLLS